MNGLSLFSGIGGLDVALSGWVRPILYCEIDSYCQAVLLSRMHKSVLRRAPICPDILSLSGLQFRGYIDIIYAGFPCQNISCAGTGEGLAGKQSGLFFEIVRLAKETKPKFIFLENVPAISARGGLQVVSEIAEMGYDCRWCVISAASVGAMHVRERWFLLAYSQSQRFEAPGQPIGQKEEFSIFDNENEYDSWPKKPEAIFTLARMDNGLQSRSHRIRALGNAVVPQQAKKAFKILMGLN